MPLVSVIIPIYNTEDYLREALDSIINQTYKDMEIICINDGSKDNSLKIMEEYAQKANRIVIHTGLYLQRGLHLCGHATFTVRSYEDAQVVDTHRLHQVEFFTESLTVAALSFRTEDSTIPEVCSYIIIGFTILDEVSVTDGNEFRLGCQRKRYSCHHTCNNQFEFHCYRSVFSLLAAKLIRIKEKTKKNGLLFCSSNNKGASFPLEPPLLLYNIKT